MHGALKVVLNEPSLPDLSLKRTSDRTTRTTPNDMELMDTHHETFLKEYSASEMVVLDSIENVSVNSSILIDNYFASTKLILKPT
ncbi:unnamed protein product [Rotaria sordida]|uniref:Uncharacterized protein n=1 Tax=Rotaria sordida TaxID=392033 RepID=A0A814UFD4_9BILA|nr:unnamed protein product [Rotaria sordida]CAF1429999.1 unnamed protein product [Rotaria sordida]CAF4029865.1 unnamed protein product [Rotaria sordida]